MKGCLGGVSNGEGWWRARHELKLRVRFSARPGSVAGGRYGLRRLK